MKIWLYISCLALQMLFSHSIKVYKTWTSSLQLAPASIYYLMFGRLFQLLLSRRSTRRHAAVMVLISIENKDLSGRCLQCLQRWAKASSGGRWELRLESPVSVGRPVLKGEPLRSKEVLLDTTNSLKTLCSYLQKN